MRTQVKQWYVLYIFKVIIHKYFWYTTDMYSVWKQMFQCYMSMNIKNTYKGLHQFDLSVNYTTDHTAGNLYPTGLTH